MSLSAPTGTCGHTEELARALARWFGEPSPGIEAAAALGAGPWAVFPPAASLPAGWEPGLPRALAAGETYLWSNPCESGSLAAAGFPVPVAAVLCSRPPRPAVRLGQQVRDLADWLAEKVVPELLQRDPLLSFLATSPSLAPQVEAWRKVARTNLSALLCGETGTGKEVVARALHRASGRRGDFVAENCAAIPEGLLEAELFGVRRGAFTGASENRRGRLQEARGGTLFLDEIGDLPLCLQVKLLRVLQEREVRSLGGPRPEPVDIRVIAATHRDLSTLIAGGLFRSDLYYRLAGVVIEIPPLRERPLDLPFLAATLLARLEREGSGPGRFLTPRALAFLQETPWPGNIRELEHVLQRAAALSAGPLIEPEALGTLRPRTPPHGENLEAAAINQALRLAGGVKTAAARHLGWTRQKLYRRLAALGLDSGPNDEASSASSINLSSNRG